MNELNKDLPKTSLVSKVKKSQAIHNSISFIESKKLVFINEENNFNNFME